jgi:transposase
MLTRLKATNVGLVVMDRGVATADKIKWLNENQYTYLVVNRESKRIFDSSKANPIQTKSNSEVQIYKEITEDGLEARLYCYSESRSLKEEAIWAKKDEQFLTELKKIRDGLHKKRCQKDKVLIERRIGRLFEKWSGISQHYKVKVEDNSETKTDKEPLLAINIIWTKEIVAGSMMELPGVYCIKSNDINMSAESMWKTYTQLTDIEAVFKSLKSELGLRPIYHRKEQRIESHLFITVIAYQCVQIIRKVLKNSGINDSWLTIRNNLASHGRITMMLPNDNGGCEKIRKSFKPNEWQVTIYRTLRITNRPGETIAKKIQYLPRLN